MSELFAPGYAVTRTKRRRFLWAAWWTEPPRREPFRKPDAAQGGARSLEEARAQAFAAAKQPLVELDPSFARAWARVLRGEAPWPERETPAPEHASLPNASARSGAAPSVWSVLGLSAHASATDVKRAYRQRALVVHPDRGGDAASFRALHAAYTEALRRLLRKPGRRRS